MKTDEKVQIDHDKLTPPKKTIWVDKELLSDEIHQFEQKERSYDWSLED